MSDHEINGDDRLSASERLRYLYRNLLRNIVSTKHQLRVTRYHPNNISAHLLTASPLRAYTETFLTDLLASLIPPRTIHVLDIGCGSGRYSDVLASVGFSGDYVGVDIGDKFQHQPHYDKAFRRSFQNVDIHNYTTDSSFDLIFSMSALEHIDSDDRLIDHLETLLSDDGVQLHIVPGSWGLPLYLWHGYRQYNLSSLEARFGVDGVHIYALGGLPSFFLHFLFITLGEMVLRIPMRRWFSGPYRVLNRLCVRLDRYTPSAPAGYIVLREKEKRAP